MNLGRGSYSLLLHVLVNWHQWLDSIYRNVGIASFALLLLGSILGRIYAQKLLRAMRNQHSDLCVVFPDIAHDIAVTKTEVFDTRQRIEQHISELRQDIARYSERHELKFAELREELKSSNSNDVVDGIGPTNEGSEAAEFPSSVTDYLSSVAQKRSPTTEARSDFLHGGNLIASATGEFVIVSNEGSDHQLAVPQVARFSSSDDFTAYFRDYFECDAPSAGEVWIIRPAVVRTDDLKGGWRVERKGKLELRQ